MHAFVAALMRTLFIPVELSALPDSVNLDDDRILLRFDQSNMIIHHVGKEWNLTNTLPRMTVVDHWGDLRKAIEVLLVEEYGSIEMRLLFIEEDSKTEHHSNTTAALAINVFIAKMILIADCELEISFCKEYAWFRLIRPAGGRMTISSTMVLYP